MGKVEKDTDERRPGFFVTRDEDGNIEPVNGITPNLAIRIKVIPMSYGESKKYQNFSRGMDSWTDKEKVDILKNHIVSADGIDGVFDDLTVDDLNNMEAWTVEDLLGAIALYSGLGRLFEKKELKEEDLPAAKASL